MYRDSLYAGTFSLVPEGWEDENIAPRTYADRLRTGDDTIVVLIDGDEVEWSDYVEKIPDALLLGFWNENGWGTGWEV